MTRFSSNPSQVEADSIKLSVHDQSVVRRGVPARNALSETLELAKLTDKLGYNRFWVAEHHGRYIYAGSSPEVLVATIAGVTKRIRIGTGAVIISNHSTLKVAENFRTLEALFPQRIDMGIGRAFGGNPAATKFLNPNHKADYKTFEEQLLELQAFFADSIVTADGPVIAMPTIHDAPPTWLITSGGSSHLAGKLGMGLVVPVTLDAGSSVQAVEAYYQAFKPSPAFPNPQVILACLVVCGESEREVVKLRKAVEVSLLQASSPQLRGILSVEEAEQYSFTQPESDHLQRYNDRIICGTPDKIKKQFTTIAQRCKSTEFLVTAFPPDVKWKNRSYELLAETFFAT